MNNKYIKGLALLGITLSIGLTSCQVVNKYKAPEVDTTDLYRDMISADTTTIASIPWREYFADPYLQALIDEGLNNSFDMQIVLERIKQAEAGLSMARAAYFPSIALSGQVNQTRLSAADPLTGAPKDKNVLGYHKESYTLGVAATWELDIWGKLNRQSRAKYAQMLNSYAGRNLVQTSLISNIADSYYSLLALDEQLRVTKEMIALMEESAIKTEAMKEAGMTNRVAVEQTKAAMYSAQASIPDLEINIRKLENGICLMLGRKPGTIGRSTLAQQSVPTKLAYGVPVQMLAKRPDVQQAELSFRSAFELTNVAQASFYPQISLSTGLLGYTTTNTLSNFFKPENIFANIIGGLTQPLFAKKQLITQLKVAKSDQQIALLTFQQTVLSASQEVSNLMYTFDSSLKKNGVRAKQVESLSQAVEDTKDLQNSGDVTYLDIITAQQSLLKAQLDQVNDKLEQLQVTSDLYRALGGGIE